ncbi:MAG: DUF2190 family protein [Flavobacteriales bacterium]|nr:DUF2190 family protein [Flavobacteriales bacterium]
MYQPGDEYSALTAADLSEKQYHVAKTDATGKLVLATAATDDIIGVINDGGRVAGDTATVQLINGSGTFKVKAGGTIAKGAYLTTDASGQAVATTTAGNRVFGRAVRAAVAGDIVEYIKYNELV